MAISTQTNMTVNWCYRCRKLEPERCEACGRGAEKDGGVDVLGGVHCAAHVDYDPGSAIPPAQPVERPVEWQTRYVGDPRQPGIWIRACDTAWAREVYESTPSHTNEHGWEVRQLWANPQPILTSREVFGALEAVASMLGLPLGSVATGGFLAALGALRLDAESHRYRRTVPPGVASNVEAWQIGEAHALTRLGGDPIDRGLSLLNELQDKGYGVVKLGET